MVSNTVQRPLAVASQRVIDALLSLDAAVDLVQNQRAGSAESREKLQAEITASWEVHTSGLEADIQSLQQQNTDLKQQNEAIANELQSLKQQYVTLQHTAGKVAQRLDQSIEQLDMLLETA